MDKNLVIAIQALLNVFGGNVVVDGVYGPQTKRASDRAEPIAKELIELLKAASNRQDEEVELGSEKQELIDMIASAADRFRVPVEFAVAVAKKESDLNPTAVSPSGLHYGLFQLGMSAVADAKRRFPGLSNESRESAQGNAFLGVAYLKLLSEWLRVGVEDVDDQAAIYSAFNLGIGNYRRLAAQDYDHPRLVVAVSAQADALSKDGPRGYLKNVAPFLQLA